MKGDKNLSLINESSEQLELHTDYHRLKRIILNLLTNALKYTMEGFISVKGEIEGDIVTIVVKDSGLGMEKESLNKLFKEFNSNVESKTESTRSVMNKEGIGLGLVTSLNLVEKLGPLRRIQVESEKGKGSRFSFQIFQNLDFKMGNNSKKGTQNGRQGNQKKKFTSIFDRIFETEEILRSKSGNTGDQLMTQLSLLQQPVSEGLKSKQEFSNASHVQSSSIGTSSSGKRKLQIFVYEACEEVLEVRTLLEDFFSQFKTDFSLSFQYGNTFESSVEKIVKLEQDQSIVLDFVYMGLSSKSSPEELKEPIMMIKRVNQYYKEVGKPLPQYLLINNSEISIPQLNQIWSPLVGPNAADSFFDIFEGIPNEAQFNKVTSRLYALLFKSAKK